MMKIILKILAYLGTFLLVLMLGLMLYLNASFPNAGPLREFEVKSDSATVARGEYLANHVTVCIDCHSARNWKYFAGPVIPGTEGAGGEVFDENMGLPGKYIAKNLTPYNLANWTNGEIFRAFAAGVNKHGKELFPIMPYLSYGRMDMEDAKAIIAYIRTLKPIKHDVPASRSTFPMSIFNRMIPSEPQPQKRPSPDQKIKYGKYLVNIAGCGDCHTPAVAGKQIPGKEFAGGMVFKLPEWGTIRSANITPDEETGIGFWTENGFVERFQMFAKPEFKTYTVTSKDYQSIMPWTMYGGMSEQDLRAIYAYLRTLTPVKNKIVRFEGKNEPIKMDNKSMQQMPQDAMHGNPHGSMKAKPN